MKALIKKYAEPGLWLDDVPVPKPGINDVLIKIRKTAICGTDVHIYNWDDWAQKTIHTPMVIGHEYVGTVEAFGENVQHLEIGELVSGEGHIVCGYCRNCMAGRRHLCNHAVGVGVNRSGAFAEYLCIPKSNIWPCNPNIPTDILSCFDPLGNAVHTALSFELLGEDVLITGAGPIGCMAAAVAKHAGARYVVVTDVNPYRLELAKKMGATRVVDARTCDLDRIEKELGMKEGFDVGLEMSGNTDALEGMLEHMFHGGKVALLGLLGQGSIDWDFVIFNGLTLKGIYGRKMFETWYKMTSMIQTGLDISAIITHRFHYTEFQKAFELMCSGHSGKIVLSWEE
ncbi:L-threonine 3-dehydrogenase [candidate division KSB3 bacterium]|uniref:L-threonine 3-dehydrogenase n=1 Tax=candidate division KSB3 bacterium TaxID=2044937 RepID=A0A2G6KF29_9BACT|nr:MAG: L-threonine 3-dehydrogenase [candidate division KSB3 bacterium]